MAYDRDLSFVYFGPTKVVFGAGTARDVEAEMSEYNPETYPVWSIIGYEFPARGDLPPLKWVWYDGGKDKPARVNEKLTELAHGNKLPGSGSLIVGDKGTLYSPNDYGAQYKLLPEKAHGKGEVKKIFKPT